jgi:hypothetical protein
VIVVANTNIVRQATGLAIGKTCQYRVVLDPVQGFQYALVELTKEEFERIITPMKLGERVRIQRELQDGKPFDFPTKIMVLLCEKKFYLGQVIGRASDIFSTQALETERLLLQSLAAAVFAIRSSDCAGAILWLQ